MNLYQVNIEGGMLVFLFRVYVYPGSGRVGINEVCIRV